MEEEIRKKFQEIIAMRLREQIKLRSKLISGMLRDKISGSMYKVVQFPDNMPEAVYGGYEDLNDDYLKNYLKNLSSTLCLDVYCLDFEKNQSRLSQVFSPGQQTIEWEIDCFSYDSCGNSFKSICILQSPFVAT